MSAEELSREPGELITKAVSDDKLRQLQMDEIGRASCRERV